jgi:hypothetical protein
MEMGLTAGMSATEASRALAMLLEKSRPMRVGFAAVRRRDAPRASVGQAMAGLARSSPILETIEP